MPDSANGSRELDEPGGGTAGGRRTGRGRDGDGTGTSDSAGSVLLSLAANLAQAQPTAWGQIAAAYRAARADDLTRGTSPCLPASTPS